MILLVYGAAWCGRQLVKLFKQIGSNPIWTATTLGAMVAKRIPNPQDRVRFFTSVQKRVKHCW